MAERLYKERVGRGITQQAAAHVLDVSITTYNRWERGVRKPQGRNADRISAEWAIPRDLFGPPRDELELEVSDSLGERLDEMDTKLERLERILVLVASAQGVRVPDEPSELEARVDGALKAFAQDHPEEPGAASDPAQR